MSEMKIRSLPIGVAACLARVQQKFAQNGNNVQACFTAIAAVSWLIAAAPQAAAESEGTLYVTANSHLDMQFQWTVQNSIQEDLPRTLADNLALLKKYPDFRFSFEGAFRYMLAKEYYPELYAGIKEQVEAGRWFPSGSMLESVDVNIPSPESLIRQVLYGNGFFLQEFGKASKDLMLTDSFGFSYALPSVAAHCGLLGFSSGKLSWGSARPIPFDIGQWEGPDGSQIFAVLQPGAAGSSVRGDYSGDQEMTKRLRELRSSTGIPIAMRYVGTANKGGALPEQDVKRLGDAIANPSGSVHVVNAGSDEVFTALTKVDTSKLPVHKGELLMQTHGVGTYTAQGAMKRWNRQNEMLADAAERAAALASWMGTIPYPAARLRENWIRFLWHQTHDDLAGVAAPRAYEFSWDDLAIAANNFGDILTESVGSVARHMDTRGEGQPIVVFNPSSFSRGAVLFADVPAPGFETSETLVRDPDGNHVPAQLADGAPAGRHRVAFHCPALPAGGAAVFHVVFIPRVKENRPADGKEDGDRREALAKKNTEVESFRAGEMVVSGRALENARYRVSINAEGDISSIHDKTLDRELLQEPIRLQFLVNPSEMRPAWRIHAIAVDSLPQRRWVGDPEIAIREKGAALVSVRITRRTRSSVVVQEVRLAPAAGSPGVEIETHIDWAEEGTLLKLAVPTTAANPLATYDIGLGTIDRPVNSFAQYEVPAQKWASQVSADGSFGVSIITDCKYGWDKPSNSTLRSTLLHTPGSPRESLDQATLDHGRHRMRHVIVSHAGDWKAGLLPSLAEEINQPPRVFNTTSHEGPLGKSISFLSGERGAVEVMALKQAEDGSGFVIRVREPLGRTIDQTAIQIGDGFETVQETNGAEEGWTPFNNHEFKQLRFSLKPHQMRTFRVRLKAPAAVLPKFESTPLPLAWDSRATLDANGGGASFDLLNVPIDEWPSQFELNGVPFTLGAADGKNVLRSTGQTIQLPAKPYKQRAYLLLGSTAKEASASVTAGGVNHPLSVPLWSERIGKWDHFPRLPSGVIRGPRQSGFLRSTPIAWSFGRRYDVAGVLEAYRFCHLFRFEVEVPADTGSITLPKESAVGLFALTMTGQTETFSPAARLMDSMEYLVEGVPLQQERVTAPAPTSTAKPILEQVLTETIDPL